jgi:hypothetical protein
MWWQIALASQILPLCQLQGDLINGASRKERRRRPGILCTFWWMIWKEHNNRIFDNKHLSHLQVADLAREEIKLQL